MEELLVGDIIELLVEVDWVDKPDQLRVVEIVEYSYRLIRINGTYKHSDNTISDLILPSNLKKDLKSTRDSIIDQVLSHE